MYAAQRAIQRFLLRIGAPPAHSAENRNTSGLSALLQVFCTRFVLLYLVIVELEFPL